MTERFEVFNPNGKLVIASSNMSFVPVAKQSVSAATTGAWGIGGGFGPSVNGYWRNDIYIDIPNAGPAIVFAVHFDGTPAGSFSFCEILSKSGDTFTISVGITESFWNSSWPSPIVFTIYAFSLLSTLSVDPGFGLELFDENGVKTFSSARPPAYMVDAFSGLRTGYVPPIIQSGKKYAIATNSNYWTGGSFSTFDHRRTVNMFGVWGGVFRDIAADNALRNGVGYPIGPERPAITNERVISYLLFDVTDI